VSSARHRSIETDSRGIISRIKAIVEGAGCDDPYVGEARVLQEIAVLVGVDPSKWNIPGKGEE
jgi:hypothetical protein